MRLKRQLYGFLAAGALLCLMGGPARGQSFVQEKTSTNAVTMSGTNWTTPSNIQTDNGAYAVYANTAQDWLFVKQWGFTIPGNSLIDGIMVVVQGNGTSGVSNRRTFNTALTKDGTNPLGTVGPSQLLQTTDSDIVVSTAGASWGQFWTPAEINSANFGAMIQNAGNKADAVNFDTMTVTAYYRTIDDVTVSQAAGAPGTVQQGADYAVSRLSLSTNRNQATWTAVTVTKTGTLADGSVTAVKIYLDANANGTYEPGSDTQVGAGTFSGGSSAITLSAAQTITTTAKTYFVVYNLSVLATIGDTIGAQLTANTVFTVTYPDTVLTTNFTIASGNSTVTDGQDTVTVTGTDKNSANQDQGASFAVEQLAMATNQEDAKWTALTVTKSGTLADSGISAVGVYRDENDNGAYDSGTDALVGSAGTFSGGTAALTLSPPATLITTSTNYFIVYTLAATANPGDTFGGSVASAGALTLTAPDIVSGTFPMSSTNRTVVDVADTVAITAASVAPADVVQGGEAALLKLTMTTNPGVDSAVWTALTVTNSGTLPDNKITTVKIYLDDGSGSYDGGDTLISPGVTTFSGGTAAITLSAAQTITPADKVYFIVYGIDVTATPTQTAGAQVAVSGDVTVTAPDLKSGTFPMTSGNTPVIALGDIITVSKASLAPGSIAQGTALTAMESLSMVTDANSAQWTAITVKKTGTLADSGVSTVRIYKDANANGTFQSGTDTLISPAVTPFSSGLAAITLSGAETITTSAQVFFIVYSLDAYAVPGDTIGAEVTANTNLTVTSPDVVATTNFAINSTNATVTDVADTVTVTPTNMASGTAAQGADYAVEKLSLAANADFSVWSAVTVTKTGTLADAGVSAVKVYLDANANGTYEPGSDTLITSGADTFSGGSAAITLSAAQTITTTPKVYFIVYVLSNTAAISATVGAQVAQGALTISASDTLATTNLPASSANSTVTDAADTVTQTPTDLVPGSRNQGTSFALQYLAMATNQEDAKLTAMTVTKTGTLADAMVTAVGLYRDENSNGVYNAGTDTLVGSAGTFSGGVAALSFSPPATLINTSTNYFIVYTLGAEATVGGTVGAQVAAYTDLTLTAPDLVQNSNFPANSSNATVADAPDTVNITATDLAGSAIGQNETKAMLKLSMFTAADSAVWTAVTVTKLGNLADGSVTSIRVYLDNGDGVFDSGADTAVSGAATFTGGSAAITLSAAQTINAVAKDYFIVYQIALTATIGNTIGARVNASGDITVTAPDLKSGTFPMDSSTPAVAAPDTVTATPTNLAPASVGQGADLALEKLSLATGGNTAVMTAIKVTLAGSINRTNITAVKIYKDADGNGYYDPNDTLLGSGVYPGAGAVTITLSPAQTLTTTAQGYFLVNALSAGAPVGNTVGVSVPAATDITITSPDTIATTNFPVNSGLATVALADYGVTLDQSLITLGSTAINQDYLVTTPIVATSAGNIGTTFSVKAATVTSGSPWVIALSSGPDQFTAQAKFNSVQPALAAFADADRLTDSDTTCLAGKFMGNQDCKVVRGGDTRKLWIKLGLPTRSTTEADQDIQVTVTATVP